jgi:hypothetical protein
MAVIVCGLPCGALDCDGRRSLVEGLFADEGTKGMFLILNAYFLGSP